MDHIFCIMWTVRRVCYLEIVQRCTLRRRQGDQGSIMLGTLHSCLCYFDLKHLPKRHCRPSSPLFKTFSPKGFRIMHPPRCWQCWRTVWRTLQRVYGVASKVPRCQSEQHLWDVLDKPVLSMNVPPDGICCLMQMTLEWSQSGFTIGT